MGVRRAVNMIYKKRGVLRYRQEKNRLKRQRRQKWVINQKRERAEKRIGETQDEIETQLSMR